MNAVEIEDFIREGRFLTVRETADALGLSPTSIQLLVEKGVLKAWRTTGGHRRIFPESVKAVLLERGTLRAAAARPIAVAVGADDHDAARGGEPEPLPKNPRVFDVLVAEDDAEMQRLYQARLRVFGDRVAVRIARDGVAALLAVGQRVPDLMILDVGLPGLSGLDALHSLRADERTARMPVVVVSGLDRSDIDQLGAVPPGTLLLRKPVQFDRLFGFIEGLLTVHSLS